MKQLLIRHAEWVVAWDGQRHVYRRDADVLVEGDRIAQIGSVAAPPAAPADWKEIDGRGYMVVPGLINLHAHPATEPGFRGVREDHGNLEHYMASMYERFQAFRLSDIGRRAALEVAYTELLQSGVTTLCDLSFAVPGWEDVMRRSGIRVYVAPGYSSGRWIMKNKAEIGYKWDEQSGRKLFTQAIDLIDTLEADPSGRFRGIIYPAQIDTTSEDLFRDSIECARTTGRPITTHASQAVMEFLEIVRRHAMTPVQWLHHIGFLGCNASIGHCIFIDEHSAIRWHSRTDIDLLVETGTTVAHCPSPFARYGECLQDIGKYQRRGVNVGIGTDVSPHNIIEEMRLAAILGRVHSHDIRAANAASVFHAATIGGAKALGRDDIGRLAPGAKADFLLVDLSHPTMIPVRDPLRALIWSGADRPIRRAYVDGEPVLIDGKPVGIAYREAAGILAEEQAKMLANAPQRDYAGRTAEEVAPLSLPIVN